MFTTTVYALASVGLISLISLVGVLLIPADINKIKGFLLYMVSFSAGAIFGDTFLHLLPELVEETGFTLSISLWILAGIATMFFVEKVIHWHHCHAIDEGHHHHHQLASMNLIGDGIHNFLDGIIIGASFLISVPVGIATTIAVALHEIPQEIGDFGILLHAGYSKTKALAMNFIISLTAIAGVLVAIYLAGITEAITEILIPFAVGGFIYIAGSDLIPELHKEEKTWKSILQFIVFLLGIAIMALLLLLK